jgi:hypothetical protein
VKGWDCTAVNSGIGGNGTVYDDGGYLGRGPIVRVYPGGPDHGLLTIMHDKLLNNLGAYLE